MSIPFRPQSSELFYHAQFSEPVFEVLQGRWNLHRLLCRRFSALGFSQTMRSFGEAAAPQEVSFSFTLAPVDVRVTVQLNSFSLSCARALEVESAVFLEIARATDEGLRELSAEYSLKAHTISLSLHGQIQGLTASDFVNRYLRPGPKTLGTQAAGSATFYYGPTEHRLVSGLNLEPSAIIENGLFLKTDFVWKAEAVDWDQLVPMTTALMEELLSELELEMTHDC